MTFSFGNLTEEEFDSLLKQRRAATAPAKAIKATSPIQREILFADAMDFTGPAYTLAECYDVYGPIDIPALERAASDLFRRHILLRTTFHYSANGNSGEFNAAVHHAPSPALDIVDLRGVKPAQLDHAVDDAISQIYSRGLDPTSDALVRLTLIRIAGTHSVLVLQAHHVAMDVSSWSTLLAGLTDGYDVALTNGERPAAGPQYSDYIALVEAREHDGTHARHAAYWRAVLADPPRPLVLPDSRRRPSPLSNAGQSLWAELESPIADRLAALAGQWGISRTTLCFAAYAAALGRIADRTDFIVGVVFADRPTEQLNRVIGPFVYSLPVRLRLTEGMDWPEFTRIAQDGLGGAAAHPLPLSQIAGIAGLPPDVDKRPVVQALFNAFSFTDEQPRLGDSRMVMRKHEVSTSVFDVSLVMFRHDDRSTLQLTVNPDVVEEPVVSSLLELTMQNLERLCADPQSPVLPAGIVGTISPEGEREPISQLPPAGQHRDAFMAIFRHADEHPGRLAIRWGDMSLSYSEVRDRAQQVTRRLRELGAEPGARVCLAVPLSPALVIATLAGLSCGTTIMPIDPEWPASYLERTLARLPCRVSIATDGLTGLLPAADVCVLAMDGTLANHAQPGFSRRDKPAAGTGGGYIVLTAGTTGDPKPVHVGLDALSHRLWWGQQSHPLAGSDVALLLARPTSDFAYWEMLAPLSAGASLAIQRAGSPLGPSDIAAACAENQVTVMHQVPSLLAENMTDAAFRQAIGRLRILYVGGEALPTTLAQRLAESATTLVNQYGPAETCIDVTSHWYEDHPYLRTPIGRPAPSVVVRILDASLRPVPRGSVGELWLGGPCLAYGYPGAPAITAASFLPDPYAQEPGARMYRTGDMARELANGVLDLVGRADRQLKIRGARVEPDEIESALLLHPAVRRAAAVPTSDGLLQAYAETTEVTATELAAFLRSRVPPERLPASVITRASLPLLASGKLDRHALDETAADIASSGTAARLTVDPVIAEVWARTLKLPPDSVDDDSDFFSSGGGSLEAIRLAAALREFGYSSSIRTVFESPRLADFVQNVCRLGSS